MNKSALFAEFIGTFALVFIGTGAIVINDVTNNSIGNFGIAMAFGLAVSSIIYSFGNISGAHINPAVTLSFWLAGNFKSKFIAPYIFAQFSGAIFASCILLLIFPSHKTLGSTLPFYGIWNSFFIEVLLSFILMCVIFIIANNKNLAGLVIGFVVMMEAAIAGPLTGASMNPARSFGPAIVSGNISFLIHYIIAAFIGMSLSVIVWKVIKYERSSFLR